MFPIRLALICGFALLLAARTATAQVMPPLSEPRATVPQPPTAREEIEKLIKAGRLDDALARADTQLAKNPRDVQVRFIRAVILSDQKKDKEAIAAFESLMQDFPELPEPYNNLAVLHAAAGRYEQARVLLQRSIDAQPSYLTAYENLGDLYAAMAADAYQRGLKLAPGNGPLAAKLALARETSSKLRGVNN